MEFKLPELGEGIYEAELIDWLVAAGDTVESGQSLAEVMTDKATLEVPAPFSGKITQLQAEPGDEVKVGQVLLCYESRDQSALAPTPVTTAEAKQGNGRKPRIGEMVTQTPEAVGIHAAPSVRRMARQMGIDLDLIDGSGPGGRILIDDLARNAGANSSTAATPVFPPQPSHRPGEPQSELVPGARVKLRGIRRQTAQHMVRAKQAIPHYSYVDECNVSQLVQIRESLKATFADSNVKLTFLPFFLKAVVAALAEIPAVNASLDDEAGEIVLHDHFHIGIATETPRGLLVPVLRNADQLDFVEVARQIERLTTAARNGKIRREDLRGGTFTITSIGGIGGLISTPIINHPQAAILGIGKIVKRPMYDDAGDLHPADMVYFSLSFDHRIIDGAAAASFCNAIIRRLEKPATLLLHGPDGASRSS